MQKRWHLIRKATDTFSDSELTDSFDNNNDENADSTDDVAAET